MFSLCCNYFKEADATLWSFWRLQFVTGASIILSTPCITETPLCIMQYNYTNKSYRAMLRICRGQCGRWVRAYTEVWGQSSPSWWPEYLSFCASNYTDYTLIYQPQTHLTCLVQSLSINLSIGKWQIHYSDILSAYSISHFSSDEIAVTSGSKPLKFWQPFASSHVSLMHHCLLCFPFASNSDLQPVHYHICPILMMLQPFTSAAITWVNLVLTSLGSKS